MKAAITGGAGFIGSHLADHLLGVGHEVVVLDDLSSGSMANLAQAASHPGFTFVKGSVLDVDIVDEVMAECDTVFHLAAAVGVHLIVDRPVECLATNLRGTEVVLAATVRHGRRLLLASTSEVYGRNDARSLTEDSDRILGSPLKSRWSYGTAKALAELITYWAWREHMLPAVIARLFNVVGPRQSGRYGMVLPRFVAQATSGRPLTVYGNGRQTRCFCAVSDIVPALAALMEEPRAYGTAVNLGGHEEIAIADLADRVKFVLGSDSPVVKVAYEVAYQEGYEEILRRVPNLSRAADLIGFGPSVGLDDIIRSIAVAAACTA